MAPLTDAFAADELRQQLEARGIRCVLECSIAAIDADGVRLADGRVFRAARVVLATGVQPDSRLAAQSGVLCQRGIVVGPSDGLLAAGDQRHRRMLRN